MKTQSLTGDWQFRQVGAAEWLPATVPAGVHTDLLAQSCIPDPLGDGSLLRLRSLTVAWTLLESIVTGRGFSSARLYLTGSNLITWTKYSGFNPDVSSGGVGSSNRGVDIGAYPLARAVTLGLTVAY